MCVWGGGGEGDDNHIIIQSIVMQENTSIHNIVTISNLENCKYLVNYDSYQRLTTLQRLKVNNDNNSYNNTNYDK